jgi:hypothetical protein
MRRYLSQTCLTDAHVSKINGHLKLNAIKRLVVCGYSQVPGVDFQVSFAAVINNIAFRILLIKNQLNYWMISQV